MSSNQDEYLIDISNAGVTSGDAGKLAEASKINLDYLVTQGVIVKQPDTPSTGYTTYLLQQSIRIEIGRDGYDYIKDNHLFLPIKTIFDGQAYTITINSELRS